jgi:hypothetical protein
MIDADALREACGGLSGIDDDTLESVGAMALEYAEQYTGRKLEYGEYTENIAMSCKMVLVRAWPVDEIKSVTVDGNTVNVDKLCIDAALGIITLPISGDMCRIEYTGGFKELPQPVACACGMLAAAIVQAAENAGQQITYQILDGYAVTYASKSASGDALEMLSPVAAIMLKPYKARQTMRVIR